MAHRSLPKTAPRLRRYKRTAAAPPGKLKLLLDIDPLSCLHRAIVREALSYARARCTVEPTVITSFGQQPFEDIIGRFDAFLGGVYTPEREGTLRKRRIPAVNISSANLQIALPRVVSDDLAVGRLAAEYLLGKGFVNFAFLGMGNRGFSVLRGEGFAQGLARASRSAFQTPQDDWVSGADPLLAMNRGHARLGAWLASLPRPLALFAANDNRARHAIYGASAAGLRVPEDLAVLGVDNDDIICDMWGIPLSSIELAGGRIGAEAMRCLLDQLAGKPPPADAIRIPPLRVVTRKTTDILAVADPLVSQTVSLIRDHYRQPFLVDDLIAGLPISRRAMERLFRAYLGHSIRAEVEKTRINEACRLLVETTTPMKEIASFVGFADQRQLSVVFAKRLGVTPTEYRQGKRPPTPRDAPRVQPSSPPGRA